jgi:hypothetical protein
MREGKVPLCDCHHLKMCPEQLSFLPTVTFKCVSPGSGGRYYGKQYGYFNLLAGTQPGLEQIDPANRSMKVCLTKHHRRTYMVITRPKSTAPGAKALWCWHCYECNPGKN